MIRESCLKVIFGYHLFSLTNSDGSVDLTDKFDHTFLCGDLNFRLDLSRLHADWLISNKGSHAFVLMPYILLTSGRLCQGFHV
jgi:hypothetical protein